MNDGRFPQLIDLAVRSALLRVYERIGYHPEVDSAEASNRSHPFYVLNDAVLLDMEVMGRLGQTSGEDIRASQLWPLLEHQDRYEDAFERRRKVTLETVTPKAIYDGLVRGNHMLWNGWKVEVGGNREITDDYGMPAWEPRIWVEESTGKPLVMFSGISKSTARSIYTHITGKSSKGIEDGLGQDRPHPAENIPWYAVNEDGSVNAEAL